MTYVVYVYRSSVDIRVTHSAAFHPKSLFPMFSRGVRKSRKASLHVGLRQSGRSEPVGEEATSNSIEEAATPAAKDLDSPVRLAVLLTNEQFNEVMSYMRKVIDDRKDLSEASLRPAETIDRDKNGMVALSDAIAFATGQEESIGERGDADASFGKEEENGPRENVGPDVDAAGNSGRVMRDNLSSDEEEFGAENESAAKDVQATELKELTGTQRSQQVVSSLNDVSSLHEDTFSFIISAPPASSPFVIGILVCVLKTIFYWLTLGDLMNITNAAASATAKIPPAVEPLVFFAQFFALGIAVLTQNDMIVALKLLHEGFGCDKAVDAGIRHAFPFATHKKWLCALILLYFEGILGLLATLFLTITSTTILNVLLNFAAVEFISSLDESVFYLASIGFLGKANRQQAQTILTTEYKIPRKPRPMYKIGLLVVMILLMITSWLSVAVLQLRGHFAPRSFYVQFDDDIRTDLSAHSGVYILADPPNSAASFFGEVGRFRYVENIPGGRGKFDYCVAAEAWTFFVDGNSPCDNTLAMAKALNTFDITKTGGSAWSARSEGTGLFVPMTHFYLSANCNQDGDCGSKGTCNGDRMCDCEPGVTGPRCEFKPENLCPRLQVEELSSQTFVAKRHLASSYELLVFPETNHAISINDRPVYYNNETLDVIIYSGLRWIVVNPLFGGFTRLSGRLKTSEDLVLLASQEFDMSIDIGLVDAASEPVYYNSAQDWPTPELAAWFTVLNNANLRNAVLSPDALSVLLICTQCNVGSSRCINGNPCVDGKCVCQNGESGSLCQVLPTGDGRCNSAFNTPLHDYDKGDCCALTCSPGWHPCGSINVGDRALPGLGYPYCANPSLTRHCVTGSTCYIRVSEMLRLFFPAPSYTSSINVWSNGQLAVVGEQGEVSAIRIEGDSADSIRQEMIELGPIVFQVAIATAPGNIISTNAGTIPRGIVAHSDGLNGIAISLRGPLKQSLVTQPPILFDEHRDLDGLFCPQVKELATGASLLNVGTQRYRALSVALILSEECASATPQNTTTMETVPSNATNTYMFWMTPDATGWFAEVVGRWDDLSMSGNAMNLALHDKSIGIGERMEVRLSTLFGSNESLSSFSLKHVLSSLLDANSTAFTSLDAMQMSHTGHELSIAVSALNLATQEPFGVVAKLAVATGSTLQPRLLDSVIPVAFLDTAPAFTSNQSTTPPQGDLVVFSGDGSSFAFVAATRNGTDMVDVYTTERNYGLRFGQWKFLASFFGEDHGMKSIQKIGISHDGTVLLVGDGNGVTKFGLREPCAPNEEPLYLSIVLDDKPGSVSWRLESLFGMDGVTYVRSVVRDCMGCYPAEHDYAQSTVMERICVPQEMMDCLGLQVEVSEPTTMSSVVALFDNNTDADPVLSFKGGDEGWSDGGFSVGWQSASCGNTATRSCSDSQSLYLQSIAFTRLDGSMWWSIHSNRTGAVIMNRTVSRGDVASMDSSVYDEVCVAPDDCWQVSFGGVSFRLSYIMSILDGKEVRGSGSVLDRELPTLHFGGGC